MVVAAPAGSRDQIKAELCAFAQSHLDAWESYADQEFRSNEYGFDFVSRQTEYNGNILTVSKANVPGLTLDKHRHFRENIATMLPAMDDKITIVDCPDVDGNRCVI